MSRRTFALALCLSALPRLPVLAGIGPGYTGEVAPILEKYCTACHGAEEAKGRLRLDSYEGIRRGGKRGPAVVPGKRAESRLTGVLTGRMKPTMPPKGRPRPRPEEIAVLEAWIEAGAPGPAGGEGPQPQVRRLPPIAPKVSPPRRVTAVAFLEGGALLAAGRYGAVDLLDIPSLAPRKRLAGPEGRTAALVARAGKLFAAGGAPGRRGEVLAYDLGGGAEEAAKPIFRLQAGSDALYALAVSDGGALLAVGSYRGRVFLIDANAGRIIREFPAHNGAVFAAAFRPGGEVLATASQDRTVKLWNAETGERLETFGEPVKDLYALAFLDGRRLVAGGAGRKIFLWELGPEAREGTNRLVVSRFAHEAAILALAPVKRAGLLVSAAADGSVKLWTGGGLAEKTRLPPQPDWPAAVAVSPDGERLAVGRLDGSIALYDLRDGREVESRTASRGPAGRAGFTPGLLPAGALSVVALLAGAPPRPELAAIEPPGIERGRTVRAKLSGKNLAGATAVRSSSDALRIVLAGKARSSGELAVKLEATPEAEPGRYEIWVESEGGASNRVAVYVDTLPQAYEKEESPKPVFLRLPVSYWGRVGAPGDEDRIAFELERGETVVCDLAAKRLGSRLDAAVTLAAPGGGVVASANDFQSDPDPLLAYRAERKGTYVLTIADFTAGGSPEHFYRLSAGTFAFVTSIYPPAVPAGGEVEVEPVGWNLPPGVRIGIRAAKPGALAVPLDPVRFRSRRDFEVLALALAPVLEAEPNDRPLQATPLSLPGSACGRIEYPAAGDGFGDADLYRFEVEEGDTWIFEVEAARRGSPLDPVVEVLDEKGGRLERVRLQAVRESYINFRPIDSDTDDVRLWNWEEMDLDQYLYLEGEVVKLFRLPQGPDSGFKLYTSAGKRRLFFDTSASAHANYAPCYIVEPVPPGTPPLPNGLPSFPVYYENDDDAERRLGRDSRLTFAAPGSGRYLVRVRDSRGEGGPDYAYRLVARRPQPDFEVRLEPRSLRIPQGSGREFRLTVTRRDGFEGAVTVTIRGEIPGFMLPSRLVIEAGHRTARGTIFALSEAESPPEAAVRGVTITAEAEVAGRKIAKPVASFEKIEVEGPAALAVELLPYPAASVESGESGSGIVAVPGKRVPALLRIVRRGHKDLVTFSVENLPFGVYVDDIGLNGILIRPGETERVIWIAARPWVRETARPVFAKAAQAGRPTSAAVLLQVRAPSGGGPK